jgi:hypothetical protein
MSFATLIHMMAMKRYFRISAPVLLSCQQPAGHY